MNIKIPDILRDKSLADQRDTLQEALRTLTQRIYYLGELASEDAVDLSSQITGELSAAHTEADVTADNKAKATLVHDTRSDNETPAWYRSNYGKGLYSEFKERSAIGAPGSATYGTLLTKISWHDSTGGPVVQTFYSEDGVFVRKGLSDDSDWGDWKKSFDEQNLPEWDTDIADSANKKPEDNADVTAAHPQDLDWIIGTSGSLGITAGGKLLLEGNWTSTTGMQLDSNAETLRFGGSGVTADGDQAGVFLGKDNGEYKLFVGDPDSHLEYDGLYTTAKFRAFEMSEEDRPSICSVTAQPGSGNLSYGSYRYKVTFVTALGETNGSFYSSKITFTDDDENLVGFWTFDIISGDTVSDSSGNGNSGTLHNMDSSNRVDGVVGKGLSFNGEDEYVEVPSDSTLHPTSKVAVSIWITPESNTGYSGIIGAHTNNSYQLFLQDNEIRWDIYNVNGRDNWHTGVTVSWSTLYHIVATYDSSNGLMEVYVNGVLKASHTHAYGAGEIAASSSSILIGWSGYSDEYYKGDADEARIYNKVPTAQEVEDLYQNPGAGKVQLTNIPTGTDKVTARKIYRNKAENINSYYLVTTIEDNTTTTYLDNIADNDLGDYNPLFWNSTGRTILDGSIRLLNVTEANTSLGEYAGQHITIGYHNVLIGRAAGNSIKEGYRNTIIGYEAGKEVDTGDYNTLIGYEAGYRIESGRNNTLVGGGAYCPSTGSNNTGLGASISFSSGITNAMALGYNAGVNASNKVVIGNSSVTVIGGYADWSNYSDGRLKENINEYPIGLDFIRELKPVIFKFKPTEEIEEPEERDRETGKIIKEKKTKWVDHPEIHTGLVSQHVKAAMDKLGIKHFSGYVPAQNENDYDSIAYGQFVIPLINAVKELDKRLKVLERRNKTK